MGPELTAILITLGSFHFADPYGTRYEQLNPGVIIEADWLAAGLITKNSYGRSSLIVQGTLWTERYHGIRLGLSAGYATGYQWHMIGGLQVQHKYLNITYAPKIRGKSDAHAVIFALRIPIGD